VVNRYTIAKVLVAVGLLVWLFKSGRLDFHILFSTPLSVFHVLGMLVLLMGMVMQAWRWWWLLKAQQIGLSFQRTLGLVWIGRFLAMVLPGAVGGIMVRGYYVTREAPSAKIAGLSSIVLDRSMGLYASFLLSVTALVFTVWLPEPLTGPILHVGVVTILFVMGGSLIFLTLWLNPTRNLMLGFVPGRFRAPLEGVLETYRGRGRCLLACLALSLAISIMAMGAFVIAGHAIGAPVGWEQAFMVCPLVFVASALPISPSGIGVGETAASVLFARFGVETGATIMLTVRLWYLVLRLPGGLLYVFRTRYAGCLKK
jgi:uncharacterized membrane protein YbhN (UPF0104 family)